MSGEPTIVGPPPGPPPTTPPPTTTVQAAVPPPPKPAPKRRKRRQRSGFGRFVTDKAIPLLIAFLGLVATLATTYGAMVTADINDLEDKRSSLENEVDDLTDENAALGEEVDSLSEENAALGEEVEEAASATTGSGPSDDGDDGNATTGVTTPTPDRASSVLRETGGSPVTFSSGYSIDVDSPAPDWGVRSGNYGDLYFACCRPHLYTHEVSLVDHVPTEAECDDATLLQGSLGADPTRVGTQFCMRTPQDRFVYVHIVAIDEEAETITLDLIVWK